MFVGVMFRFVIIGERMLVMLMFICVTVLISVAKLFGSKQKKLMILVCMICSVVFGNGFVHFICFILL